MTTQTTTTYLGVLDSSGTMHVNVSKTALAAACGAALPIGKTTIASRVSNGWHICPECEG